MTMKARKTMEISVIVPVYNVRDYIDECLESLVSQTFTNYEILLLNDGSTDGSTQKCEAWAKREPRIRYIPKYNEGLSATRNLGIRKARGRYIAFVDSDDWVDCRFLELLYGAAELERADIAECDFYRVNHHTGWKTRRNCYGAMGKVYSKEERMLYGNTIPCKCLYKRELWVNYQVKFPDCHSPARAVYALLVALGNKVASVREALYYYRKFRPGSLSANPRENNGDEVAEGVKAYRCLASGFKRCGIYDSYRELLESMIVYKSSDTLSGLFGRRSDEGFRKRVDAYVRFLSQDFSGTLYKPYVVWGGYNLSRLSWYMKLLHRPDLRFNFSSFISLMYPINSLCIKHGNPYRQIMVQRDISSDFWRIIDKERPHYLIMDFLEERFDLLYIGGGYITKSDAYDETEGVDGAKLLRRDAEACFALWKKSCIDFLERIKRYIPKENIVLVKNYLSEKVGDVFSQNMYENVDIIRKMNKLLSKYYDFFVSSCPQAIIIDPSCLGLYFTDKEYEYGVIPSHLNEIVNRKIAEKINKILSGNQGE